MIQDATAGLGGDGLQVLAWIAAVFSAICGLRFLYACWKGGDQAGSKGLLGGLTAFSLAVAYIASEEAARMYAASNGFKTGDVYLMFFTMMPGGMLLVAPFVLMFSSVRKEREKA